MCTEIGTNQTPQDVMQSGELSMSCEHFYPQCLPNALSGDAGFCLARQVSKDLLAELWPEPWEAWSSCLREAERDIRRPSCLLILLAVRLVGTVAKVLGSGSTCSSSRASYGGTLDDVPHILQVVPERCLILCKLQSCSSCIMHRTMSTMYEHGHLQLVLTSKQSAI